MLPFYLSWRSRSFQCRIPFLRHVRHNDFVSIFLRVGTTVTATRAAEQAIISEYFARLSSDWHVLSCNVSRRGETVHFIAEFLLVCAYALSSIIQPSEETIVSEHFSRGSSDYPVLSFHMSWWSCSFHCGIPLGLRCVL